jgi:hypothetical protein
MENQKSEAIDALTRALDNGFGHWSWIDHDADLDSIRDDPAFIALMEKKPSEADAGAA